MTHAIAVLAIVTAGACTTAMNWRFSYQFCETYRAVEARLKNSSQEPDPQAALFARLTGFSAETVRFTLSIFLAIACEVISALGFFAILQDPPKPSPTASNVVAPVWK